jgi:hypothetical protein
MADASPSRLWQVFLVLGLIACVASLYFLIGGSTFAAVSGLVTVSIALLNAFLSPATAKEGENWFVGAMKRTLVVGRYTKVLCVLLWVAAFVNVAVLAWSENEKKYRVDIEGVVTDKWRGTPLEKALVTLKLTDGASLTSNAPAGQFKFTAVDSRKVARQAELEAVCEGAHGKVGVDLSRGSVKDMRIVLAVSVPPTRRTFFVLSGHAIDILVRDKKLPTELEAKLGGNITVIETPAFRELSALMERFSQRMKGSAEIRELYTGDELYTGSGDSERPDAQTEQHQAALKKIEKEQLKRLEQGRVLAPAGGELGGNSMTFDAVKLPRTFFLNAQWSINVSGSGEILRNTGSVRDRTRLKIPFQNVELTKFATRADFDALLRAQSREVRNSPDIRFIEYASRSVIPPNFLRLKVAYSECGEGLDATLDVPNLKLRVVVLENVTDKPVELGEFHFRAMVPSTSEPLVRTAQDNTNLLAGRDSKTEALYSPRVLKPGEKLLVPLELILSLGAGRDEFTYPDESVRQTERVRSHEYAKTLSASKEIQTIALVYKQRDVVTMPKEQFIDGLQREPARIVKGTEFVYGPSIALDGIDVNGARYTIEPFNPANVAYFSGIPIGSCPFVYCRDGADDKWLRQGSILRGRRSKSLEGIGQLTVHGFDGVLRISEEEAEISYIDELFVRARSVTGEYITMRADDERLAHKDGRYVVLKKGESITVNLAIPSGVPTDQVRVTASGYFEPTSPMPDR